MIGFPLVAIVAALIMRGTMTRSVEDDTTAEETEYNPNEEIDQLRSEVPEMVKEGRAVIRALRSDATPEIKVRARRIQERVDEWMQHWDEHFDDFVEEVIACDSPGQEHLVVLSMRKHQLDFDESRAELRARIEAFLERHGGPAKPDPDA